MAPAALVGLPITPVILTFNEEANIGRQLQRLSWARRIVVVDSLSTDRTREICTSAGNVAFFERAFVSHAEQWNFAVHETGVDTEWVLALDADYMPTDAFLAELPTAVTSQKWTAYRCPFRYVSLGRRLRASLYPPVVCLFRRELAMYRQDGHTQRVRVDGPIGTMAAALEHDDRKPLRLWLASQQRYAALEAEHLLQTERSALSMADRIRLIGWPAPFAVLLHVLLLKGCLFDGRAGWFYTLQRLLAEVMLALELADRRSRSS